MIDLPGKPDPDAVLPGAAYEQRAAAELAAAAAAPDAATRNHHLDRAALYAWLSERERMAPPPA